MYVDSAVQWPLCICEKWREKSDTILVQIGLAELKMSTYSKQVNTIVTSPPAVLPEQAFPLALAR